MHFVITGGAGHISAPLSTALLAQGHQVTVVGRNADRLAPLVAAGAKAAVGSVEDAEFLKQVFSGADGVYLMIPPNFGASDWLAYQRGVADHFVAALVATEVPRAVLLSSVGAHMGTGAGPVDGLAYAEKQLATLTSTQTVFLRPSYFMYNLLNMIPLVQQAGIMGANFGGSNAKLVLTDTTDIASEAARLLAAPAFGNTRVAYVASDERTTTEIAQVIGHAIGKPDLAWVEFTDEQALAGMTQAGLPLEFANGYVALGQAIREGKLEADYWANRPAHLGLVKLEDFARQFAQAFQPAG